MTEFFVCSTGQLVIPREMFHLIMSFIPAFPYYFVLRSVCSQWLIEFQDQIYGAVEHLSLVDDGRPKYFFRSDNNGGETLVRFKSIVSSDFDDDKTHLFEFLANMFPNVKHLRLSIGSLRPIHFNQCVNTMLPKLTQLETLDILGTVNPSSDPAEIVIGHYLLDSIARSLPSSIKSLNFIGVLLGGTPDTLARLKMFSNKGRQLIRESTPLPDFSTTHPHVDVQSLSLTCIFWNQDFFGTNDWKSLQEMYLNFEASVVDPSYHGDNYPPTIPVDSYLTYMSKKEGVVLSRMMNLSRKTYEITEAVVDIVVHEYPIFQPLLSLGAQEGTNAMILRAPQTKFDVRTFYDIRNELLLRTLELLTDPSRMKYPELVFNIDSTVSVGKVQPSSTLLGHLITRCSDGQMFNLTKTVIDTYYPSMTVNGVRNYLVETIVNLPYCGARTDLMRYLLILKPELISLGDLDGIINGDQKDLQIIQLFLNSQHNSAERDCLEDIKYLVTAGASLTQVDREGNNVLHSACRIVSIDLVKYLLSLVPDSLLFERNKQGQTPIELIYLSRPPICLRASFLGEVAKFPCFKNQALTDYKTSCGTLLHAAVKYGDQATAHWLIHNGFDANISNDKGENVLFSLSGRTSEQRWPRICYNQADFIDGYAVELIKAGAQFDIESTEGETVVTFALRNKNYQLINIIIQTPSISSEPLSKLLAPRMKYGLNALHYLVQKMVELVSYRGEREVRTSLLGIYPVAKHCAQLCLEHYPEMLHEQSGVSSEDSKAESFRGIRGVSPLQILLRARRGLFLMEELSIDLSVIANKPVFASKDPNVIAPIPVLYLALDMILDIPLFDRLMTYTDNVLIRDETQANKPNLLHIAVERGASLCQCVINHWKERYPNQEELNQLINQPLENTGAGGQKPTNAALIACRLNRYEVFSMLWPFMKPVAAQFDCPVKIALESNHHQFVVSAVKDHAIFPTKAQLHRSIRKGLPQSCVNLELESNILYLMVQTEAKQPNPSWLDLFAESPSDLVDGSRLSTLQLIVYERAESIFSWLVQHYSDDPLLDRAVRAVDPLTGNTLLHLLTNRSRQRSTSTILFSLVSRFELDDAPIRTNKFEPTALPSLDHLNMKELTEFINIQDKSGRTCLHYSGRNRIHSLLSYLLILGASTEIQDSAGRSPLVLMDSELKQIVQKFLAERARKGEEDNGRGWQRRWQP